MPTFFICRLGSSIEPRGGSPANSRQSTTNSPMRSLTSRSHLANASPLAGSHARTNLSHALHADTISTYRPISTYRAINFLEQAAGKESLSHETRGQPAANPLFVFGASSQMEGPASANTADAKSLPNVLGSSEPFSQNTPLHPPVQQPYRIKYIFREPNLLIPLDNFWLQGREIEKIADVPGLGEDVIHLKIPEPTTPDAAKCVGNNAMVRAHHLSQSLLALRSSLCKRNCRSHSSFVLGTT